MLSGSCKPTCLGYLAEALPSRRRASRGPARLRLLGRGFRLPCRSRSRFYYCGHIQSPLWPTSRTKSDISQKSEKCHGQTHALQHTGSSFDYLGEGEQRHRQLKIECFGRTTIDH